MKKFVLLALFWASALPASSFADDIHMKNDEAASVHLTIYTQNAALVQMEQKINIPAGFSVINFDGVSEQMLPQTSLLDVDDMKLIEKTYEYNVLNNENLLRAFVGKKIKTVRVNPLNGKNIFEEAVLLNDNFGSPLLQFDYGIESQFPGRIVFESVPKNLKTKPTLVATINNPKAGEKSLSLTYLTSGVKWSTNYVAELNKDDTLDLHAWAEVSNNSGALYHNADIVLLSGNINIGDTGAQPRPMMFAAKSARMMSNAVDSLGADNVEAEALSGYYTYHLPEKITLPDKQSKQLSLWRKPQVKIEKLYKIHSYLMPSRGNQFENQHASVFYKIVNTEENNLGLPLPQGKIRFYEKNSNGETLFLGTSDIRYLSSGEKAELKIGESFDLFADGKIVEFSKISEKISEASYQVTLHNSSEKKENILFMQNINGDTKLISESLKSSLDNVGQLQWKIEVPAKSDVSLTYKLRTTRD